MFPRDPSPCAFRIPSTCLALALAAAAALAGLAPPARAVMTQVKASPANPSICDAVTLSASGVLSSPCYDVVDATLTGPEPPNPACMGMVCPALFQIRVLVRQPAPGTPCPTVLQPYTRSFQVGKLPPGAYSVRATEILFPFGPDSTSFADSTSAYLLFFVAQSDTCPPQTSCVILGFALPPLRSTDIAPRAAPSRAESLSFCTAAAPPGGTGCFDLTLHNDVPVGGLQTEIAILDPLLDPPPGGPTPPGEFSPVSIAAAGRAAGLQADWNVAGGVLKVILYSTNGATIPPGDGRVLHLCYQVAPGTHTGHYLIRHQGDVVADSEGTALQPCPTLRETTGEFCVAVPGCDLDGDGVSNIVDIVRLVRCALGSPGGPTCPDSIAARADCNGDGAIDVRDIICCVRKILSSGPLGDAPAAPGSGEPVRIGFAGPVQWVTPTEGRAVVQIDAPAGFAGIQFGLDASGAPARVRELRLLDALPGDRLEWAAENGDIGAPRPGTAVAMIYSERSDPRPAGPIRVLVLLDPAYGSEPNRGMALVAPLGATATGERMPTALGASTAEVPLNPALAPAVFPAQPNPFATETRIAFALPAPGRATLRVYDVAGRLVRTLADGPFPAGARFLTWDGKDGAGRVVRSGLYFLRLDAGGVTRTGRMLRLR